MEDPAHGAAENAAMVEAFKTATGGAERANKDQFTAFYKMVQERGAKRGNWENMTAEFYDKNWSLVTRVDPSKEGASLGDFMAMTEIVVGKLFECKAKDAASAEGAAEGAEGGPQLPADLVADLQKFGEDGYNKWKTEASPEQKEAGNADLKKFQEDPAHGAAEHQAMVEAFSTATGGAERANKDQFTAFYKMVQERGAKRGNWEDTSEEFYEKNWALVTRVHP